MHWMCQSECNRRKCYTAWLLLPSAAVSMSHLCHRAWRKRLQQHSQSSPCVATGPASIAAVSIAAASIAAASIMAAASLQAKVRQAGHTAQLSGEGSTWVLPLHITCPPRIAHHWMDPPEAPAAHAGPSDTPASLRRGPSLQLCWDTSAIRTWPTQKPPALQTARQDRV